jgi:hypothetical protein
MRCLRGQLNFPQQLQLILPQEQLIILQLQLLLQQLATPLQQLEITLGQLAQSRRVLTGLQLRLPPPQGLLDFQQQLWLLRLYFQPLFHICLYLAMIIQAIKYSDIQL